MNSLVKILNSFSLNKARKIFCIPNSFLHNMISFSCITSVNIFTISVIFAVSLYSKQTKEITEEEIKVSSTDLENSATVSLK